LLPVVVPGLGDKTQHLRKRNVGRAKQAFAGSGDLVVSGHVFAQQALRVTQVHCDDVQQKLTHIGCFGDIGLYFQRRRVLFEPLAPVAIFGLGVLQQFGEGQCGRGHRSPQEQILSRRKAPCQSPTTRDNTAIRFRIYNPSGPDTLVLAGSFNLGELHAHH
jgi:hypothetical protein